MKQNYSIIIVLLALMSTSFSAFAEGSTVEPFIELVPTLSLGKDSQANLQLLGGATWKVSDEVGLGFGTGAISSFKFDATPSIPLFFRSKFDLGSGNIIPYVTFDAGYNFNLDDIDNSTILLSPTIGFRTHGFYLGAGYLASISTSNSNVSHNLAFRLGYQFGGKSAKKMRTPKFIKQSQVKFELGCAYDFDSQEHYVDYQYASHIGNAGSAKLIWMFRLSNQFQLGIGSGFDAGFYKCVERYDDSDTYTTFDGVASIPVFIRPQYNIHFGNSKFVPFVSCDVGYKFDVEEDEVDFDGLMIEPQVGVSYKRLSLGVGGRLTKYEIHEYEEKPHTRIIPKVTIGFTFN